jgi:DNA-binding response OmpR family regulator
MDRSRADAILVVESDHTRGCSVAEQLAADGYGVELARSAEHARILARESSPRLVLLGELDPPSGSLRLLEEIRAGHGREPWDPRLPAIVLASRADELDVLRAFEAGADDFLSRAASYLELRARLRAILRRCSVAAESTGEIGVGPMRIDTEARRVSVGAATVGLRRLEYELLLHLARAPERVFARQELLGAVWGYRSSGSTRTLDSHASRVRRKLDLAGAPGWVVNVWGVGYRLI